MVLGGAGVTLGFQTPVSAFMLIVFLIPTFKIHHYRLQALPDIIKTVRNALPHEDEPLGHFRFLERQVIHAQETGWQNNLVLLAAALFFSLRGCIAFGLDNLMSDWVVRLF